MSAGGSVSAFAGESASLVSGRVSVTAAESLSVSTGTTGLVASQDRSGLTRGVVSLPRGLMCLCRRVRA